jgi:hypothetical protein
MHPDLTDDPADRERRQNFMARVNDPLAELVRTIRRIAQVGKRLLDIDSRLADLASSDPFRLRQRVLASEEAGNNLLREVAESVETQIRNARMRLSQIP